MDAKTIIKWGLAFGVSVAFGTQVLTWLGLGLTNWFVLLTYVLLVIFVYLGLKDLKQEGRVAFNYLNTVLNVIGIIIIARMIFQSYMFIYTHYIDPALVDAVAKSWTISLQESNVAADKIEQQIKSFRKSYETIPMFTSALISYAIPQFIIGVIVAVIYVFTCNKKQQKDIVE